MEEDTERTSDVRELRRQAEARLKNQAPHADTGSSAMETLRLLHELQVHQIELQVQNEELLAARSELEAGLARYTELYDFAPVGYVTLDVRGRIQEANIAGAALLGVARRNLINQSFLTFLTPDSRSPYIALTQRLQYSHDHQTCEFRLLSPFGMAHTVQARASAASEGLDPGRRIRLALIDISDRKAAEQALQKSEAQLAGIIGSAMDAIICLDETQRVVLFNTAAEQVFHCKSSEAFGRKVDRFLPGSFRKVHSVDSLAFGGTEMASPSLGAADSMSSMFGVRAGGEQFPIEASISQFEHEGSPLYTVIIRDITERKQAETASQQRNDAIVQTIKAMKTLPEMEGFLKQMLAILNQCLNATSTSLWLYNPQQKSLSMYLNYPEREPPALQTAASGPLSTQDYPTWTEIVRTRQPLLVDLYEDLSKEGAKIHKVDNHKSNTLNTNTLNTNNHGENVHAAYFNRHGWAIERDIRSVLFVPLLMGDEALGCFSIGNAAEAKYGSGELELAQTLAQQASLAVQMTRLAEQGRQSAVLQERNRIAQEIHDTLAQGFTGILAILGAATQAPSREQVEAHIKQASDLARESLQEARRSVHALRPQVLEKQDLPGALTHFIQQNTTSATPPIIFQVHGTPRKLSSHIENDLFRIGQEALRNALRHAEASTIEMVLTFEVAQVRFSVQDDGKGFDIHGDYQEHGYGLIGIYERTERLSGQMHISSGPVQGTRLTVVVPAPPVPLK